MRATRAVYIVQDDWQVVLMSSSGANQTRRQQRRIFVIFQKLVDPYK